MELRSNNFQILFTFVLLLIFGEIMVLSSSMVRAESIYDNPFFFASRQAIFISIGFIIFCFLLLIPSDFLRKFDWLLLILSFISSLFVEKFSEYTALSKVFISCFCLVVTINPTISKISGDSSDIYIFCPSKTMGQV